MGVGEPDATKPTDTIDATRQKIIYNCRFLTPEKYLRKMIVINNVSQTNTEYNSKLTSMANRYYTKGVNEMSITKPDEAFKDYLISYGWEVREGWPGNLRLAPPLLIPQQFDHKNENVNCQNKSGMENRFQYLSTRDGIFCNETSEDIYRISDHLCCRDREKVDHEIDIVVELDEEERPFAPETFQFLTIYGYVFSPDLKKLYLDGENSIRYHISNPSTLGAWMNKRQAELIKKKKEIMLFQSIKKYIHSDKANEVTINKEDISGIEKWDLINDLHKLQWVQIDNVVPNKKSNFFKVTENEGNITITQKTSNV